MKENVAVNNTRKQGRKKKYMGLSERNEILLTLIYWPLGLEQ
jgi:hypothetical protein